MTKRPLFLSLMLLAAGLAFTACQQKTTTPDVQDEEAFATDTLTYEQEATGASVTIIAEYPTAGPALLVESVKEYISEVLGGTYTGAFTSGQALIDFYGQAKQAELNEMQEELEGTGASFTMYDYTTVTALENAPRYVTYQVYNENFQGGAHGLSYIIGATFRKSDGKMVSQQLLKDTDTPGFHQLLVEGLLRYFAGDGDADAPTTAEDLDQWLFTGSESLTLPSNLPYLTSEGVTITYTLYEIAPYAAGIPQAVLPYDKVKPYLTPLALQLINEEEEQ